MVLPSSVWRWILIHGLRDNLCFTGFIESRADGRTYNALSRLNLSGSLGSLREGGLRFFDYCFFGLSLSSFE